MPSPDAILVGLAAIANDWRWLAISWHGLLAAFVTTILAGWRPSTRIIGCLLVAPLSSVGLVAWLSGNPFNAAGFGILVGLLVATAVRLPQTAVRVGSSWWVSFGAGLVAFGWAYPHFLGTDAWMTYAYASPFGILPCPTLSVVIGVTLLFASLGSTTWTATLAMAGLLYGAIGVFRLGVVLDWVLLLASATLAAAVIRAATGRRSARAHELNEGRLYSGTG